MENQEKRNEILEEFMEKMERSGYGEEERREVVKRGIIRYEKVREQAQQGQRELHRPASSTSQLRVRKKLLDPSNWWKKRGKEPVDHNAWETPAKPASKVQRRRPGPERQDDPVAVLFIRRSNEGKLIGKLREKEKEVAAATGYSLKLVERAGTSIKNLLWCADPWGLACITPDCPVCKEGTKPGMCRTANVVYRDICLICKEKGRCSLYIGETSRSLVERGLEHQRDNEKKLETSHLHKHQEEEHTGAEIRNKFEVVKRCSSALERQCWRPQQ